MSDVLVDHSTYAPSVYEFAPLAPSNDYDDINLRSPQDGSLQASASMSRSRV